MRSAKPLIAICLLFAGAAGAQNTAPPPADKAPSPTSETAIMPARVEGVATVGDLARVTSQRILAEERKKMLEAQRASSGDTVAPSAGGEGSDAGQGSANFHRAYETPIVVGIHGSASAPYALVRVSDATVLSVRKGDTLPGGWTVRRVAPDGVTVSGAAGTRVLGFSASIEMPASTPADPRR